MQAPQEQDASQQVTRPACGGLKDGPHPRGAQWTRDRGRRGRCAVAALAMTEVAEGLASSSGLGRSDASRGGGGKRQAGRREGGGRSAELGRRVGGAEGKGSGQRGRGRGGGVGAGDQAAEKASGGREGGGGSARSRRTPGVRSFSPGFLISPRRAFPFFSVPAWSPRRCVTTPQLARAGKQLQNFPQTSPRGRTWAAKPGQPRAGASG